ncbi:hypothetical protein [Rhodanobacter sp. UC4436_H3]
MNKKLLITPLLVVAGAFVGCGQSVGDNAPAANVAAGSGSVAVVQETTESLPGSAIQPMSAQSLSEIKMGTSPCSFDSVDGNYSKTEAKLDRSNSHTFRGWALTENMQVVKDVKFVLKGTDSFSIMAKTGTERPDVASYLKDANLSSSGFNFSTTLESVPAGVYQVLLVTRFGEVPYACETKKSVTVF